jgi:hypothetical protein
MVLFFVIFPWLAEPAFLSADEIRVDDVESIRIQLLNHPDGLADIGPVELKPDQFDAALAFLRSAEPIDSIPGSAMLGEYRIRNKLGGRGTIRLRFQPGGTQTDLAPVWMQVGSKNYRCKTTLGPLWLGLRQMTP